MGHCVDREMAQSQGSKYVIEAAQQAHYIKWADIMGIPDPCRPYSSYQYIVAIYIKYVQCRINFININVLCSATIQGYAKVVNTILA